MPRPRQLEKIPTVVWNAFDKVIEENKPLEISCSEERIARRYEARFREFQASVYHFSHPNWREYHALQVIRRGRVVTIRHVDNDPDLADLEAAVGKSDSPAERGEQPMRVDLPEPGGQATPDSHSLIDDLYGKGRKQ